MRKIAGFILVEYGFSALTMQRGSIAAARFAGAVRCGAVSARNFVTDPLVVVEVLSPSIMDNGRDEKLMFYKWQPILRHIILVYQD
jgi:hypothetical protein